MRKLLTATLLFIPFVAFALDYTDSTSQYTDAPFGIADTAGISLLTNMGVVHGNPNGAFAPYRTLNRAEFLKIAFLVSPDIAAASEDADNCFPDVAKSAWFSRFVCLGKKRGFINGYPDGLFHPERNVNYAEALKILEELFHYAPEPLEGDSWFSPYGRDARERGLDLQDVMMYDAYLARGQMARLAAAYVAYSHDDLANYRRAERGLPPISSSSSSTSSSSSPISSSSSSSASSVSSASSSSATSLPDFPAVSHFLVAGARSKPIGGATFFANLEPMFVQRAEVKLKATIDAIDTMYLVDSDGRQLGQLSLDKVFDPTEKTWRGSVNGTYRIEKGEQRIIGVEVLMNERDQGGSSEQLVQMDSFKLTVEGEWSTSTSTAGTDAGPFPKHQTSMGQITSVQNAQDETGALPVGFQSQLASFTIGGNAVQGATLKIEHLEFQVSKSSLITVTNWQLGIADSNDRFNCSYNDSESRVSCLSLTDTFGTLGATPKTFRLYGDVALATGSGDRNLQISLSQAGDTSTNGAVRWTDGTGHFNWVDLPQPLARSTSWK